MSFYCTNELLSEKIYLWSKSEDHFSTPKSHEACVRGELQSYLMDVTEEIRIDHKMQTDFPIAYAASSSEEQGSIDAIVTQEDEDYGDLNLPDVDRTLKLADEVVDEMEELPLAGFPKDEAERRRQWLKLPRKAKAAIRQLHKTLGHKPREVVLQILKGSQASPEYIQAAELYKCDSCTETAPAARTHPVAAPKPYIPAS